MSAISVVGLDGAEQLCTVTNEHSVQKGDVTFTQGRVDSIFDFAGTVSILDPGFGRRIVIEKEHSASTIVWNPAEAKAADMHHEDWKHFVCVEVGNVRQNAVFLQPGQSHTISLTITVEKLN